MKFSALRGVPCLCLLWLAGCGSVVVEGTVSNVGGERLPGVAVMLEDTSYQALTNGRGEYRFVCAPGDYDVLYAKSGYSTGRQTVRVKGARWVSLPEVTLWNLPAKDGVFLFEDHRYTAAARVTPERFYMSDGSVQHGTRVTPEARVADDLPTIICYKTPRYDARLSRLQEATATLPTDKSHTFPVWTAGGTVSADLQPVTASDPSLLRLRLVEPVQPGMYAVHWGALEGYFTIDERMFVFEVREPVIADFSEVEPRPDLTTDRPRRFQPVEGEAP